MLSTTLIPYEKYIQQCCISIVEHCGISLASIKAQQKLVSVTTILYGRSVKHSVEEIFILIWDFPSFFMASVSLTSLLSTKYSTKNKMLLREKSYSYCHNYRQTIFYLV